MKSKQNQSLQWLAESALMLAAATVLSEFIKIPLPFGGSITVFGQVPLLLIAYRCGLKRGLFTSLCFGLIQVLFGVTSTFVYLLPESTQGLAGSALLLVYVKSALTILFVALADYLLAFGSLALGGLFRGRFSAQSVTRNAQRRELVLGAAVAGLVRFLCHFISGVTVWRSYASAEFFEPVPAMEKFVATFSGNTLVLVYSFLYNLIYMLPETLMCVFALLFLGSVLNLRHPQLKFPAAT